MIGPSPMCMKCGWFNREDTSKVSCAAYPDGIPEQIIENKLDHRVPQPGDHGITFIPIDPEDTVEPWWPDENAPSPATSAVEAFNPGQPRDVSGRWVDGAGVELSPRQKARVRLKAKKIVAQTPMRFDGIQELVLPGKPVQRYVVMTEPTTGSTGMLPLARLTPDNVRKKMAEIRRSFGL